MPEVIKQNSLDQNACVRFLEMEILFIQTHIHLI